MPDPTTVWPEAHLYMLNRFLGGWSGFVSFPEIADDIDCPDARQEPPENRPPEKQVYKCHPASVGVSKDDCQNRRKEVHVEHAHDNEECRHNR